MAQLRSPGDKPAAREAAARLAADFASVDVREVAADALIVNLFEGVTAPGGATGAVDAALDGQLSELAAAGDISGKLGATCVVYPRGQLGSQRVIVVGLGSLEGLNLEAVRRASASAFTAARRLGAKHVATIAHGAGIGGLEAGEAAQATLEGALLASYAFDGWRSAALEAQRVVRLTLVERDESKAAAFAAAVAAANAIHAGVSLARDLVNMPPNVATPTYLAERAQRLAESVGLHVEVGDLAWAESRGMGAYVAVARGSANPPAFVRIEHNRDSTDLPTVVLVGKGVTFDTGGLSLKTFDGMATMKGDMGGAAAVIGTLLVVALLDLPLRVVGLCPCVENMPDGAAFRPSDVVIAGNGLSIEILSTDAEGRLALADALVHAKEYSPSAVVDVATLTGASVVALGAGVSASLFASDEGLASKLVAASQTSGEKVWRMPLFEEYREAIASKVVADLKNSGGRRGGVGTAAAFLQAFTDYPWAHLDIAGMELVDTPPKSKPYLVPGATGFGVRLLLGYLRDAAARGVA